ncbi:MAG: hypothetical protein GX495_21370 [Chloroflexi bacterium]|jgi:hypothetical protein|nr:hypothetical protein [Chloroflexota bacterium]
MKDREAIGYFALEHITEPRGIVAHGACFPGGRTVLTRDMGRGGIAVSIYDTFEQMLKRHITSEINVRWLWTACT